MTRRLWLALAQGDLAERLEVSASQVSKYESGTDVPSALMLARIASALGTTPNDLLGVWRLPEGATAHLQELSAILADAAIMNAVRSMQQLTPPDRVKLSRLIESYLEVMLP